MKAFKCVIVAATILCLSACTTDEQKLNLQASESVACIGAGVVYARYKKKHPASVKADVEYAAVQRLCSNPPTNPDEARAALLDAISTLATAAAI